MRPKLCLMRVNGGRSAALRVAEYSLLSPMRDFHGDRPGHCRLFFGFARDLIDSKARLRAPAECRTSLVIGVQQIRGVRSTEPMSRGGNAPAAVGRLTCQLGFRLPNKPSVSPFGPAVK